jgi:hypothetical protein
MYVGPDSLSAVTSFRLDIDPDRVELYVSDAANAVQAAAVNVSVPLSRFVVSRVMTMPESLASSTQLPPFASL